jgi:hypothetical protein
MTIKIDIITIPESREDADITEKYLTILDKKNQLLAKKFTMEPQNVTLQFYDSKGALVGSLGPNQTGYGIYSGYVDGSNEIKVLHPNAAEGLLNDISKEIGVLIDFALTKMYLCKKYYPNDKDFKLYHRYLSDAIGRITAGNYHEKSCKFDIKLWFEGIKYKKEQELGVALYLILKASGLDFIYENLDTIMEDLNISKSVEKIYNKPLKELIKPVKETILEEERIAQELEKKRRAAQRDAMISDRKERELKFAQKSRGTSSTDTAPRRVHISSGKYNEIKKSSDSQTSSTQNKTSSYSTSNNRNYKNPNGPSTASNKDKANFNNPNNPNYKGSKESSEKKSNDKSETKPNGYNTDRNKPQNFVTPNIN